LEKSRKRFLVREMKEEAFIRNIKGYGRTYTDWYLVRGELSHLREIGERHPNKSTRKGGQAALWTGSALVGGVTAASQ